MCGITGIVDLRGGRAIEPHVLQRMNDSQWHRGPDEGEIFNDQALMAELNGLGYAFRTKSDTVFIIHAREVRGEDCVLRLRGMVPSRSGTATVRPFSWRATASE